MKRELDYVYFRDKSGGVVVKKDYWQDAYWKYSKQLSQKAYSYCNEGFWIRIDMPNGFAEYVKVLEVEVPQQILTYHLLTC